MSLSALSLDLASLRAAYLAGTTTPATVLAEVGRRLHAHGDPAVWIYRLSTAEIAPYLARLADRRPADLPLYGVPFAIKDNLDLAGVPTTAACPEFGYIATDTAPAVQALLDAGAIPVGKTNLDQFATGLVGVRSPYGTPANTFNPAYIPGGSSSGSAVAVAAGLVSFSLGTDTAGSGRVPASFNNLVGLKPTKGWFSTRGVVPACRSLDCVSVFSLTVADASAVAAVMGRYDEADPFARPATPVPLAPKAFRFGVPRADQLDWFGDTLNPPLYAAALKRLEAVGGTRVEINFAPFAAAARLLYEGPWVAERWSAIRAFHADHADAIFPVTRQIIKGGARLLAVDAFEAQYRLAELRRAADATWTQVDTLVLPTAASIYTQTEVAAEPIKLNSILGSYTNFANLLDTAAIAVPVGLRADGLPFGVTLFGPAWSDARMAALAAPLHAAAELPMGATSHPLPRAAAPTDSTGTMLPIAVVGAHLSGEPLNHQLTDRGGRFVRSALTAPVYRFYALANCTPPKPGLQRVAHDGASIAIEIWELPKRAWAEFVASIPPPHGIGALQLVDGTTVPGYQCEPVALARATDITAFGGWRAYRKSIARPA